MNSGTKGLVWCAAAIIAAGIGCASAGPGGTGPGGAGPGGEPGAAAAGPVTYSCKDGRTVRLERGEKQLRLTLNDGRDAVLLPIEGSKGATYGDGIFTLTFRDGSFDVHSTTGRAPLQGCAPQR